MAKKFIINNGNFVLGHVEYHKELAKDHSTTKGGGYWNIDLDNKILYLDDESADFGPAKKEDIVEAFKTGLFSPSLAGFKVMHKGPYSKDFETIIQKIEW